MTVDINIRPCSADELTTVLELWQQSGRTPSPYDTTDALKALLKKDDDAILVAEHNNQIVGTVMGGWDGWRGNIYRLAVLPEHRRQGIGRTLVQEIEKRLAKKGAGKIYICIEYEQDAAVVFWNAMGNSGYHQDYSINRYTKSLV